MDNSRSVKISALKARQSLPLDMKIVLTIQNIRIFIDEFGTEGVYIPFSGGKDSTVLLDIIRKNFGDQIPAVFSNTKNEFISIIEQIKYAQIKYKNIQTVMSDLSIEDVINKYGYPVVSKKTSRMLRDLKKPTSKNAKSRKLYLSDYALNKFGGLRIKIKKGKLELVKNSSFKVAKKHRYLIDAPFEISEKCCDALKKQPMSKYEKETGRKPIIATMAIESKMREESWLKHGCNQFNADKPKSTPMAFWTEQDVLEYIIKNDLKIASVYGEIKRDDKGNYYTTGEKRTGCVACLYGIEFERDLKENRIQRLARIEPKKYDYVINKLGFKDVLEYMNLNYKPVNINEDANTEKVMLGSEEVEQFKWIV